MLPREVVELLSFHGPVEVAVGDDLATGRAWPAPVDDDVVLLVRSGDPLEAAWLRSGRTTVHARDREGRYRLRIEGRASAGRPLVRHPQWQALEPWLPDGARPAAFLATDLVPLRVDLVRETEEGRRHHFGPTPEGRRERPAAREWMAAALGGAATPFTVLALVVPWFWLSLHPDFRWRPLALALAWTIALAEVAGFRLLALEAAFRAWREGRLDAREAAPLVDGRIAPVPARRAGLALLGVVLLGTFYALGGWGLGLTAVALLGSLAWLAGPAWLLHARLEREG